MFFSQVVGQQDLKSKVIRLIQEGRLPHAINLLGNKGCGNLPFALALAQYIHCQNKTDTDSCGKCSACKKNQLMQHPDVHFSFPVVASSKTAPVSSNYYREFREFVLQTPYGTDEDWFHFLNKEKQGNMSVAECRDIIQKLQLRSVESDYKVLIIWYPEYLGKEGNILLKLIEEPMPNTIILFVTTNIDKILHTIQSRAQIFPLKRITIDEIKNSLIEKGADEATAIRCAQLADGNFNEALKIYQQADNQILPLTKNLLNSLYSNNGVQLTSWVTEITETSKETQKKFLAKFIQLLEFSIRIKQNSHHPIFIPDDERKIVETLIKKGLNEQKILETNELLTNAIYHIERNANTKILFHSVYLQVQQILVFNKKPYKVV